MAANYSSVEYLSVVITTKPVVDGNGVTSSSSYGIDFYFQLAVVAIGVFGMAANALILYAMVVSKQHKKNFLIYNQNLLDLFSCFLLVITFALRLCNIHLIGWLGYLLCVFILNYNLLWGIIIGSVINLASITVERYLKVVYPVWSQNKLRRWMIYSAAAFSCISGPIYSNTLALSTSAVVDGVCYGQAFFSSQTAKIAHGIWNVLSFYVIIILIFVFCYWRILVVVRRQARVIASHGTAASNTAAQSQSNQIQSNIIKTMITVSAFYAVTWAPLAVYYLLAHVDASLTIFEGGFYLSQFISFFNICTNPFIYAVKFDPVKRVLLGLIPCNQTPEQPVMVA